MKWDVVEHVPTESHKRAICIGKDTFHRVPN